MNAVRAYLAGTASGFVFGVVFTLGAICAGLFALATWAAT